MSSLREADLRLVSDAPALAAAAAGLFVDAVRAAIADRGVFRVALAGGSTPRALYRVLAAAALARAGGAGPANETSPSVGAPSGGVVASVPMPSSASDSALGDVDWSRVHLFFGDERFVPPTHEDSNYRMVRETGLAGRVVPDEQVHAVPTELGDPQVTADRYAETLREQFGVAAGEWPSFDLVLLGMGDDGHTASLFPGTDVLREATKLVAAVWVPRLSTWRVTLTMPVLNHARQVAVLVSGAGKAETFASVIEGPWAPERWPVQGIRPHDQSPVWLVDQAAAARLGGAGR